jgi:hypothetical protein
VLLQQVPQVQQVQVQQVAGAAGAVQVLVVGICISIWRTLGFICGPPVRIQDL